MSLTDICYVFAILFALAGVGAVWGLTKTDDDDKKGGSE